MPTFDQSLCPVPLSRRGMLQATAGAMLAASSGVTPAANAAARDEEQAIDARITGLLLGTLLGDAIGGPVEFQPPDQVHVLPDGPKAWAATETLDAQAIQAAASRLRLRGYDPLRSVPEPYAHWSHNAAAGTVTDDSRHKMVLMHALRTFEESKNERFTETDLARAYLTWPELPAIAGRPEYVAIGREWLAEMSLAARWTLGERDTAKALPTERLWNGLPTCCGQMTLPPLAAIFPGQPEAAYLASHAIVFHDNGWAKDMIGSLVAGLSRALTLPSELSQRHDSWQEILTVMRTTDPYRYAQVPWSQRSVDRWLEVADRAVEQAAGRPARLFIFLDEQFRETIKWEAQVPFVAFLATAKMCDYEPLASMQICLEWGHDTDSYAQLGGAFFGALHGPEIFPETMRRTVADRLKADYDEDVTEWVRVLGRFRRRSDAAQVFAWRTEPPTRD